MDIPAPSIKLLIAVPAYNEEKDLPHLLEQLEPWKEDVLVIDDGSLDQTAKCIIEKGFKFMQMETNQGLAMFYRNAALHASKNGYTHLLAIDADGQHDTSYIPAFREKLHQYDLVTGNRFHFTEGLSGSKIASNLFAILLFKEFLNISLPDVACGYMGMKLEVIPDDDTISRFEIIYELRARHALAGKHCGSVRIPAIYHPNSQMNTNISEIDGLIRAVSRYNSSPVLTSILESIRCRSDFSISLSGFEFESVFNGTGAYRFITNDQKAREYFTVVNQE